MLINCPRCGFSQPKDRYCANCGVDMDTYKPKPTSAVKKILASPFFHITIIAAIVFASVVVIKQRQKEELQSRINFLKSGPVMVERQSSGPAQSEVSITNEAQNSLVEDSNTSTDSSNAQEMTPAAMENSQSLSAANSASTTTLPTNATSTTMRSSTATGPLRMMVRYLEIDKSLITAWNEEAKATGQQRIFQGVTMGPLLQAATKLQAPGVKVLQTVERVLDPTNPGVEWFLGTHQGSDMEAQMGFFSSLVLNEFRENLYRGDIEVQRAFRNPNDPTRIIERVSFGSPFEITGTSAYLMSGILPPLYATNLPAEANADPLLQIFRSQKFINNQSEFTLVIQFATSRP